MIRKFVVPFSLMHGLSMLALPVAAQQSYAWPFAGTEVHHVTSARGESYELAVFLPHDYRTSGLRYPALYVLDGDVFFPMAVYLAGTLQYLYARDLIIVGIGQRPITSMENRARNFTPTVALEPRTMEHMPGEGTMAGGGAPEFLTFVRDTVLPLIEAQYRTEPKERGIFGHSYGGLFALYTLFHSPETFSRYIVSSPSLWWDQRVTFRFEEEYARTHNDLPVSIYLSAGELEESPKEPHWIKFAMLTTSAAFERQLRARSYPSLRLATRVFQGEAHTTVIPFAFSHGVRTLYPKQAVR